MTLDYIDSDEVPIIEHYAFLVSESEFDTIFGRIQERKLEYWADLMHSRPSADQSPRRRPRACTGTIRTATTWKSSRGRMAAVHDAGLLIRSFAICPPSTAAGRLSPKPTILSQVGKSPEPITLISMPSTPNASAL